MVGIIDLPEEIPLRHAPFWLEVDTASHGPGLDGREQITYAENRRWVSEIEIPPLREAAARRAAVIGDLLRGRACLLRIQVCNFGTPVFEGDTEAFLRSVGASEEQIAAGFIRFSDGTTFGDGAGFALPDHDEPRAAAGTKVGASTLYLHGYLGRNLAVGAYFSVNDFLYRVAANEDGFITFNPPLRQSFAAGQQVKVSRPTVLVRLQNDDGWRMFQEFGRFSQSMRVMVREAFER